VVIADHLDGGSGLCDGASLLQGESTFESELSDDDTDELVELIDSTVAKRLAK
jgi:hypothetical protein